jgi:hypothetical protein
MGGCCTPNKRVKVTTAVASVRKKLAIASLPDEKCIFFRLYMDVSKHKAPATAPPLSIRSRPGWLVWIDRGGTVAMWLVFRYMHKMWEKNAFFVRQRSYGQFFIYLFMSLFFYMFLFCEWRIVLAGKKLCPIFYLCLYFFICSHFANGV